MDADLVFSKGPVFFLTILGVVLLIPACSLDVVGVFKCQCVNTLPGSFQGTERARPSRLPLLYASSQGMPYMPASPMFSQNYESQMYSNGQAGQMFPMSPYGPGYPGSMQLGQAVPYDYEPYAANDYGTYGSAGPMMPMQGSVGPMYPPSRGHGYDYPPGYDYPSRGYGY